MREPGRMRIAGMGLAALLLAPFWGSALVANGGFRLFQQRDWPGAAQWWATAAGAPGPNGEWARLTALATDRAGDPTEAARWAAQAVQDAAPGAPLALWQRGTQEYKYSEHCRCRNPEDRPPSELGSDQVGQRSRQHDAGQ